MVGSVVGVDERGGELMLEAEVCVCCCSVKGSRYLVGLVPHVHGVAPSLLL
jgi:hypothetical protein